MPRDPGGGYRLARGSARGGEGGSVVISRSRQISRIEREISSVSRGQRFALPRRRNEETNADYDIARDYATSLVPLARLARMDQNIE